MAKVAEDVSAENPTFPPPHGTNCTKFPDEYLEAKKRVGVHFCTLLDKRKICYFMDGKQGDPLLIAFHGGCDGKYKFIRKSPIPGVFLVSIDRPGCGESDPAPTGYTFEMVATDISELAKSLGYDEFCVMGHSNGGAWTQQLAAGLKDKVRGAILWSAVCDLSHEKAKPFLKYVQKGPACIMACMHPTKGCCGCILKSVLTSLAKEFQKHTTISEILKVEMKHGPVGFEKFKADDFWIASTIDGFKSFKPPGLGVLMDAEMIDFAGAKGKPVGHFDVAAITCPVYIVHGDKDKEAKAPGTINYYKMMYPDATFDIMEGVAHLMTVGPNEETQDRIGKAMANMGPREGAPAPAQPEMNSA